MADRLEMVKGRTADDVRLKCGQEQAFKYFQIIIEIGYWPVIGKSIDKRGLFPDILSHELD